MKQKWLDRRIAHPGPYLTLCTSEQQYLQALKDCGVKPVHDWIKTPHADATVHHMTNQSCDAVAVVCIRVTPTRTPVEVAGLLVHEAVHIWQDYCDRIGETSPGREQEAYGVQSISQELMQAYAESLK